MAGRIKVCFFIANLGDGGAQRQCIALLNALQHEPSMEIHLILLAAGVHEKSLDTSGLVVHRTKVRNFANPLALLFTIRTLFRVKPEVLISWLHPADIWAYVATRVLRRVRWIMTERGSTYPDEFVYKVRKHCGRRGAATIIANSEQGKSFWEALAPRASIRVVPNMILEASKSAGLTHNRAHSKRCLFVGRLETQKNIGAMISAFAEFASTNPDAYLDIAGQGSDGDVVRRIANQYGLSDRIHLLGFRRDVPELMSEARLILSMSLHEGMPNAVMEAVTAGLPAVVSDIPEHRALLGHDYPYYVALDASPSVAADVIAKAWTDCGGAEKLQLYLHARRTLAASSPQRVVAAYRAAFAETVGMSSRPR